MLRKNSFNFQSVPLILLLIFSILWKLCEAEENKGGADRPPDGPAGDGSAFFALRSCHQLLHSDSGEFFSPDYLCSNPPLWCNWTIQVDPGKRIHLHLEDLTPDDTCHLKQDQVHVDEPFGHLVGHKILQKCWREAKYTSSSNTLYVVLLIGGWPSPPYRGFYGRYQAFGPPVLYNPQEGFTERIKEPGAGPELMDFSEFEPVLNGGLAESENSDMVYDYYDQHLAMTAELPWEPEEAEDPVSEAGEDLLTSTENYSHVYQYTVMPTVPASTQRTFRSGRGATHTHSSQSDSAAPPASPQQQRGSQHQEPKPSTRPTTTVGSNMEEAAPAAAAAAENESRTKSWSEEKERSAHGSEQAVDGENRTEVSWASDQRPSPSEEPEPRPTEQSPPHPNMVEPLLDHRGVLNTRNHSEHPHLPGDHLFEVAVEVHFTPDLEESWDDQARSLLLSVKALISQQLEPLHAQLSTSSKRIKRLNAGVLYIVWLHIGQGPESRQVHRAVHSAMQGLLATAINLRGNHWKAVIMSVSTADVNECGTQMVLCDSNADCENQFGSYSCRCRPGFQDESRLGAGGTICVDLKAAGCSSGLSSETKGVYVLFFLLSSLLLMMLAAAGMLYHRHHHGAFLVRCHSSGSISPPDPNNNHHHPDNSYSSPADSDLPPPPPPARGPREGWAPVKEHRPAVDLPLLRFSPLLPPDGYIDPHEGGKM